MPNPIIGLAGASVAGSALSSRAQSRAADKASDAQVRAAQLGVDEQRRQFDAVQKLLMPFVEAGGQGLEGMLSLMGLSGADAQSQAIQGLEMSPEFQALTQQGEDAILANASATGGLRGGDTQGALAQFRPAVLSQLINQQLGRLGGLSDMGLGAASSLGGAGITTGNNVANLYGQMGSAQAGAALARGQAGANFGAGLAGAAGQLFGAAMPAPTTAGGLIPEGQTLFGQWGF